ncbi:MAG: uL15 family ribosomal protein, partial [Minisyncoccia bacterium]
MQVHELKPSIKSRKKKRVGRGGKRGTYSGRGLKGQKARAGRKIKSQLREMILKFPKKKGLGLKINKKREKIEVKWEKIIEKFPQGGIISPKKLKEAELVRLPKSKRYTVKIIGSQ